jgi:hypothetical protein
MREMLGASFAVFLSGCSFAAGPPAVKENQSIIAPGFARIYVMRASATYLAQVPALVSADIFIDGKPLGRLRNGEYLRADLLPGQHVVIASSSDQTARVVVAKTGMTTYVAVWDRTRMIIPPVSSLTVPPSEIDGHVWGIGSYSDILAAKILPTLTTGHLAEYPM